MANQYHRINTRYPSRPRATASSMGREAEYALNSILTERMRLRNAGIGTQFEGERDMYKLLGYPVDLSYEDYRQKFERQDIATTIVACAPTYTWRTAPIVIDTSAKSRFSRAWRSLARKLKLWQVCANADIVAGIGRYGIILLGFDGNLARPVSEGEARPLRYTRIFGEGDAVIAEFDKDIRSERYGLPVMYDVRMAPNETTPVHHTRVVHIAEQSFDGVYGIPRLRPVYNVLNDLIKIVGGGSEATWKLMRKGFGFDVKPEYDLSAADESKMLEQIEEYEHGLRRFMLTRGVTAYDLGSEVVDPRGLFESIIRLISAAKNIPRRILEGSERGELASTQDEGAWASNITERRTMYAEPDILRPLIDRLVRYGALPPPNDGEYEVIWESLFQLTDVERSTVAQAYANAMATLTNVGMNAAEAFALLRTLSAPMPFSEANPPGVNLAAIKPPAVTQPATTPMAPGTNPDERGGNRYTPARA